MRKVNRPKNKTKTKQSYNFNKTALKPVNKNTSFTLYLLKVFAQFSRKHVPDIGFITSYCKFDATF